MTSATNGSGPASALLARLHQDHLNVLKLLNVLAHQATLIAAGKRLNLDITKGVITYFRGYMAKYHHPTEELIYDVLQRRAPVAALGAFGVAEDHADCARTLEPLIAATELLDPASTTTDDADARSWTGYDASARDYFRRSVQEFTGHERLHMINEEALFRLAAENLSETDWKDIDRRLIVVGDPVFDHDGAARFAHLRDAIIAADA